METAQSWFEWASTTTWQSFLVGAGLGLFAAFFFEWFWRVRGWKVAKIPFHHLVILNVFFGAAFALEHSWIGICLWAWGMAMWGFNRMAREGLTGWNE